MVPVIEYEQFYQCIYCQCRVLDDAHDVLRELHVRDEAEMHFANMRASLEHHTCRTVNSAAASQMLACKKMQKSLDFLGWESDCVNGLIG